MSTTPEVGGNYAVGYKKPPSHSRFQPGQSGNPKGRSKGSRNFKTDLAEDLALTVPITEGNKQTIMTKQRAFAKSAINSAIQGKGRAPHVMAAMIEKHFPSDMGDDSDAGLSADETVLFDLLMARLQAKKSEEQPS